MRKEKEFAVKLSESTISSILSYNFYKNSTETEIPDSFIDMYCDSVVSLIYNSKIDEDLRMVVGHYLYKLFIQIAKNISDDITEVYSESDTIIAVSEFRHIVDAVVVPKLDNNPFTEYVERVLHKYLIDNLFKCNSLSDLSDDDVTIYDNDNISINTVVEYLQVTIKSPECLFRGEIDDALLQQLGRFSMYQCHNSSYSR